MEINCETNLSCSRRRFGSCIRREFIGKVLKLLEYSLQAKGLIICKGHSAKNKTGCNRGFHVPRAFKLDNLKPIKPLLFLPTHVRLAYFLAIRTFQSGE